LILIHPKRSTASGLRLNLQPRQLGKILRVNFTAVPEAESTLGSAPLSAAWGTGAEEVWVGLVNGKLLRLGIDLQPRQDLRVAGVSEARFLAVTDHGLLVAAGHEKVLFCLDVEGRLRQRIAVPGRVTALAALAKGNRAAVGFPGGITVLDGSRGEVWSHPVPGERTAVCWDGSVLWVASDGGQVVCLGPDGTRRAVHFLPSGVRPPRTS
jgi:hypothetical protein